MIQPTSSVGYGREADLAAHVLARPQRQRLQAFLVAAEGVEGRLHLAHPRRHPDRALLDDADAQVGETLEHAVEDHRRQGLRRRSGDAHVVDGAEVLLAAVEVGRDRQPVAEVVGIDQVAGAADVEHDRDAAPRSPRPTPDRGRRGWGSGCGGHPDATRSAAAPMSMASAASRPADVEVGERDVAGRQQPRVDRAELDHAPVVRPRRADGELEVAGVLPVAQPPVVERVEDELAGEAEQVERPRPVLGDERAGRGEVLAVHDLGGLGARGTRSTAWRSRRRPNAASRSRQLLVGVTGLAQLVAARVAQRRDALPDRQGRRGRAASSAAP